MADVAAIIGLAGRLPGELTIEALWRHLCGDAEPASEASGREPWISRTRLFLDCAMEALQDAGHATRLDADRTGLFLRGDDDGLAAGVAGDLGLRGPAVTVPGSAGAALAVVDRACRSLLAGECDLAIAGETPVRGEGAGAVVLRRLPAALADGDRILALIQASAVEVLVPPPPPVPQAGPDPAMAGEPGPARERPTLANSYTPPGNRLEAAIAGLWEEQLGIDRVGVDDNFFELGGSSIAGVRIIAVLKDWLHQEIPTVSLYEGPTVSALAKVLLQSGPPKGYDAVRERGERRRRKLQRLGRQDAAEGEGGGHGDGSPIDQP